MKPTNEWQRLVKKEKEGGGGEEWNDGPSATSKSKKSQSFPTSGSPVYRSLNQSAINWQAVPARLEGGTEHRWPVVVDPSFPISSRQNLPLPTDIHFSPWKNCRENEIHRASASSFSTAFLFTTRRSIRSTIFRLRILFKTLFLIPLSSIWSDNRQRWGKLDCGCGDLRLIFELNLWRRYESFVPDRIRKLGFSRNQEIIPRAGTTGPEKRSLIVAGRKLEGRSDRKLFSRRLVRKSLAKPDRAKTPRSRPSVTVLARAIFYYIRVAESSVSRVYFEMLENSHRRNLVHERNTRILLLFSFHVRVSPYVIISSSTSKISFPDKVFGKIAKMDLYSIFVTSNLLFLPLLHNSLPITLHRVEI